MAVEWLTADEQRTWRAYLRAGTLLTARLNRQLQADSGLSLPEYEVLVQLSEAPGGKLRPFQLGLALEWEQSRLSHLLSRMARRGFVARQDCPGDRRGAEVVLTRAGRAAIESAAPGHVAAVRRLVFDQMDSAQAEAFGQTFEAILAALEDAGQQLSLSGGVVLEGAAVPTPEVMAHFGGCACPRDDSQVDYEVKLTKVESRRTAVVAASTTWQDFPALWGQLLGEVWECLRAGGIYRGCRNIMLYLDSVPNVEIGVLLDQPCPLTGRVVTSALPSGTAAMTVHRGPFGDVGAAHDAVLGWCAAHGHRPDGIRWEIYGPHNDDPAQQWVEVYLLLS